MKTVRTYVGSERSMRVLIIGAGSVGLLFGCYLSQMNMNVTYLTRSKEQADKINSSGVTLHHLDGKRTNLDAHAFSFEQSKQQPKSNDPLLLESGMEPIPGINMVIVTVKQTQLVTVLPWIGEYVDKKVPTLFLMNGMGHQEKVRHSLPHHSYLCFGITQNGATKITLNEVAERGRSITKMGKIVPRSDKLIRKEKREFQSLVDQLNAQGIQMVWSEDIETDMLRKCIVNACINPLTALFQVTNGSLITHSRLHNLMHQLYLELAVLIKKARPKEAEKILKNGELWQEIENICRITSDNLSSMVQDIKDQRQTEIESITGYFLDQASLNDLEMPYHRFLYESICYLQN
jgi:2-dehydropantoate 2-reductase